MLTMIVLLLLGFPMMIPLIVGAFVGFYSMFGGFGQLETTVQQILAGIRPASLIAVPMFIFAADIMARGQSAARLINMVMAFVGHVRGGLAVSTAAACTMFGAVSGSTQATVVAVGSPLRPRMLKAGYKDSFVLALIINASDVAFLIPPSIGMIIYGVVSGTSIAELFIAGIGPGLLILVLFSMYSMIYAKRMGVPAEPKASWGECFRAVRSALWPLGFLVIIIGGIYGGIFRPTEAAAVCVLYALILEVIVFRELSLKDVYRTFLGRPAQTFLDAEAAVLEGMEAGLAEAKSGNRTEDIANAFFRVLRKHGFEKENRTGYPIGLSYPPDWGERTASLRPGDKTVLESGMTFHFMTGLWMEDWGFEITESIAIGETGPEILANVPRKLFVKD